MHKHTQSCVYLKSFLLPETVCWRSLKGAREQEQVCGYRWKESGVSLFPLGQSCSEREAHFRSQESPKFLHGEKEVDSPIDGSCQGQSNSVATTTCQVRWRSHSLGLCGGDGEGRIEIVTLGLKELKSWSHLPKAQAPLRKVIDERSCLETSRPEGGTRTILGSKSPQISLCFRSYGSLLFVHADVILHWIRGKGRHQKD